MLRKILSYPVYFVYPVYPVYSIPTRFVSFFFLTLLIASCASGSLSVQEAWARLAPAGGNGAIYFVIDNPTAGDDQLLSASSPAAEHVEMHMSAMTDDDTMSMHPQHTIPVPARSQVEFEPGGMHVMLINLTGDLKPGDTFPATLEFEKAGEIQIEVSVKE